MRAILALLTLMAFPALATEAPDQEAARAAIVRQQESFRRDDAAGAYAQAAPAIQRMFDTPERFIGMVRDGYAPVYRNRRFDFDRAEDLPDGSFAQSVRIQDQDGTDWVALYTLAREPDGSWRITGCQLRKAAGIAA
ncbi:hypothetical protein OPKNFCMD_3389 [Methylobacterium crusticola]|uniref:DUF4864 domain-containing protein n=1 Tax=Methylobacterium crusticola TaxID=1697972 RepID=A0ABQ4R1C4_9HYPH|nr:DUF4864 domain-containing protein [Methylobacterium crusticola]GJD50646.1 hypothetical protein OPKNFCMD_3389 [Methylobacterium crusticola]